MIRILGYIIFIFVGVFQITYAEVVTVSQQIGADTTPPTIPTSVTATAISVSQIDVAWTASTDDTSLSGYQVFRDSVQIATTSATAYSDVGLLASTTYSYTVVAYDWLLNTSTSSATATATTLQNTTVAQPSSGGLVQTRLVDLKVIAGQTTVQFAWSTNIYARYAIRWGTTEEYSAGSLTTDVLRRSHETFIQGLDPDTKYFYELIAYNQQGIPYVLSRDSFTTSDVPDITPPVNVANLQAIVSGDNVYLSWENPPGPDFEKIRIVRNYLFYPVDTVDGFVVYEGNAESFLDTSAFLEQTVQYYTVFAYDTTGNISSGVVVSVAQSINDVSSGDPNEGGHALPEDNSLPVIDTAISFSDVQIQQSGADVVVQNNTAFIESGMPVTFMIPYELLPPQLKTIIVSIQKGDTKNSYLLKTNTDRTKYQAVVPPVYNKGSYAVVFSIYNYKTEKLSTLSGTLQTQDVSQLVLQETKSMKQIFFSIHHFMLFLIFLLLLLLFYILWRYIREVSK